MSAPRPDPVDAARDLVLERFPGARQAWLGGSAATGGAAPTSDLDVTVLLDGADVRRESLHHAGWPVELFVHTEASVRHFVDRDVARRRPTMARLVSASVPLLDGDPGVAQLRDDCAALVAAGPPAPSRAELDAMRYVLTDQLDDLADARLEGRSRPVAEATAVEVWRLSAELLLAAAPWWAGSGKWLLREVAALDDRLGTANADALSTGLRAALAGDPQPLTTYAVGVLDTVGGRLWSGFTQVATLPSV